jgi:hypothetical protein
MEGTICNEKCPTAGFGTGGCRGLGKAPTPNPLRDFGIVTLDIKFENREMLLKFCR